MQFEFRIQALIELLKAIGIQSYLLQEEIEEETVIDPQYPDLLAVDPQQQDNDLQGQDINLQGLESDLQGQENEFIDPGQLLGPQVKSILIQGEKLSLKMRVKTFDNGKRFKTCLTFIDP